MGKKRRRYIRVGIVPIEDVLPYVFTREVRHRLRAEGFNYRSREWIEASRRGYQVMIDGQVQTILVPMGSHRYQLYAEKGTRCRRCGLPGTYFALERGIYDNPNRFHFNLYGRDKRGYEVMITKDHILPRSKGGKNKLSNYQPLCIRCNQRKADKVEHVKYNSTNRKR
jgi:5-methylcytosine-specific restriction endonuclease McrA